MYKIAAFSDIHGNLEALTAILEDLKGYDEVVFLGDAIGIGPEPSETLNTICNSKIKWILGNHELYFIKGLGGFDIESFKIPHYKWVISKLSNDDRIKIKNNSLSYIINKNGYSFEFCHYFIKNPDLVYPYYSIGDIKRMNDEDLNNIVNTDYIIYGHDHTGYTRKVGEKHLIDVGSSGCTHNDQTFYTIIEIDDDVKIYKKELTYNRKQFEEKLEHVDYPNKKHILKGFYGIVDK